MNKLNNSDKQPIISASITYIFIISITFAPIAINIPIRLILFFTLLWIKLNNKIIAKIKTTLLIPLRILTNKIRILWN